MNPKSIKIIDYSYKLLDKKIAKYPLSNREQSKLLVYEDGMISEKKFNQISDIVPADSLLVVNNTKVIQARMYFKKETGAKIEIFCLNPIEPADYEMAFSQKNSCKWKCIVGNLKKWKNTILTKKIFIENIEYQISASRVGAEGNSQIIEFSWKDDITFGEILENSGNTPIPPYLNRMPEESDKTTYQTVYSEHNGSVAAPTAGLHFTDAVFQKLQEKNIDIARLTLHVGAGTFKPVKAEKIGEHEMHTEQFFVTKETLNQLIANIGKITSVGTTSMRTLESLYWLGVKIYNSELSDTFKVSDGLGLFISQWEVYDLPQNIDTQTAFSSLLKYLEAKSVDFLEAATQIIIAPGYKFKVVNNLITNFHQPQSTLLLLVSAFIGEDWKKVYDYALENDFRFLSYGDSSFLKQVK